MCKKNKVVVIITLIFLVEDFLTSVTSKEHNVRRKFKPVVSNSTINSKIRQFGKSNKNKIDRYTLKWVDDETTTTTALNVTKFGSKYTVQSWKNLDTTTEAVLSNSLETTRAWKPDEVDTTSHKSVFIDETTMYVPPTKPIVEKQTVVTLKKDNPVFQLCEAFKPANRKFQIDMMVDVWQSFFYKRMDKVQCFKIYIKKISNEEKQEYLEAFGDFGGKVHWTNVYLEIKSSAKLLRRHFIQGDVANNGVLTNVIIVDQSPEGKTFFTDIKKKSYDLISLKAETPNQWLVYKNLLLMRDCETGGILVFSRVPITPGKDDLDAALKVFGETPGGEYTCSDQEKENVKSDEAEDSYVTGFLF